MTYTIQAPNAAASPGLFPSQANTNFQRLYDIINNDHIFNFASPGASPNNDGTHRQVTFTNLAATPSALPTGTNSILYAKAVGIASQLFFWNGASDQQITPVVFGPKASAPLLFNQTSAVLVADYDFVGFGVAYSNNSTVFRSYVFMKSGGNINSFLISETGPAIAPSLVFSVVGITATISIRNNVNNDPTPFDIVGALFINPTNT